MSDVSPDDLTARLREMADLLGNGRFTSLGAADRIDALSADVARLTAELIEANFANEAHSAIKSTSIVLRHERDEALVRVAERDATIERLRDALIVVGLSLGAVGRRADVDDLHLIGSVLADTAPTPETHNHAPILQAGSNVCVCGDVHSEGSR